MNTKAGAALKKDGQLGQFLDKEAKTAQETEEIIFSPMQKRNKLPDDPIERAKH